jgi:hypothetical protein
MGAFTRQRRTLTVATHVAAALVYVSPDGGFWLLHSLLGVNLQGVPSFLGFGLPPTIVGWIIGRRWAIYLSLSQVPWLIVFFVTESHAWIHVTVVTGTLGVVLVVLVQAGLLAFGVWMRHWDVRHLITSE